MAETHQQRGIESALRERNNFYRLLENLPAAAYTCDAEGLITYYNSRAVATWGREPKLNNEVDRFCGSFKLFSADGSPINHDRCWMALALKDNKEYNGHEIIVERPDGDRCTVLAHANPIHDESGQLVGAVNVLVDISDRKQSENLLRQADQYKNQFLATLAHELRNPLAPLCNGLQLLRMSGDDPDLVEQACSIMEGQLQQMVRLVDDLLDVSRITRDKLELRTEQVELATVMQNAVETTRPLIDASGHELTVKLPQEPILLNADPMRLAQVFANLLNNASKYIPEPGHIRLTAERQGSDVVVSVQDDGIGIPANQLHAVFEMFNQVDRSLERSQGGLGIGLTLVKRLVEMHGGTVDVHSEGPNQGSLFSVRLPLIVRPPAQNTISCGSDQESLAATTQRRILVVDDNKDSALTMGLVLKKAGHEVHIAHDGLDGFELASTFRPEVILLDIGMPRLNGYDTCRRIREQPWGRDMLIIALTGWGQDDDRRSASEAGFDHHLVKPVNHAILGKLLTDMRPTST